MIDSRGRGFICRSLFTSFVRWAKAVLTFVVQTVVYSSMRNGQCPKIYRFANPLSIQWVDPRHLLSGFGADTPFRFRHLNSLKDEVAPDLPWNTWPKFVKYIFPFFKRYVFALVPAIARDHFENFICDSLSLPCHIWLSSLASFLPGFGQRCWRTLRGVGEVAGPMFPCVVSTFSVSAPANIQMGFKCVKY